jgi:hypothetical protein
VKNFKKINNNIILASIAYYVNFFLGFFINFLCIHGHYNGEPNWQNIMSITGYVIGLILMFIFTKLNPNNHFDFLKRFSFLKLNVYYIHYAYMSLLGLLFIMIP